MREEIILSIVTGIVSAIIYSLFQWIYIYAKWTKTKYFFLRKIFTQIVSVKYSVMTILLIDPMIYESEDSERFITNTEFAEQVKKSIISLDQYGEIDSSLKNVSASIEKLRSEALSIPIFRSSDFHAVDSVLGKMSDYESFYSWIKDEPLTLATHERLKTKIVRILSETEFDPFCDERFRQGMQILTAENENAKKIVNHITGWLLCYFMSVYCPYGTPRK